MDVPLHFVARKGWKSRWTAAFMWLSLMPFKFGVGNLVVIIGSVVKGKNLARERRFCGCPELCSDKSAQRHLILPLKPFVTFTNRIFKSGGTISYEGTQKELGA